MNSLYTNEQLTELYEKTQPSVYAVVYSIVKNEQDALDLTQDAYISAFTNIEKINDIKKFDKWVIQIAANKCKDFLRKKKPTLFSQVGEEDEDFEKDIPDSSDAYNPDVVLESNEKKEIIKNILYSLPEDQRLCLVLYYGQELKISEIASALDISENTVKSRLTYGKKKMKEQVEELERKGTKLHGVAGTGILPLIRQLFASNSIVSPPAGVLSATELLAKATQGANVVKQATSISKVFAKVTSIVTKNLATKIISASVATAVVVTGTVAVVKPDLFSKQTVVGTVSDGSQINENTSQTSSISSENSEITTSETTSSEITVSSTVASEKEETVSSEEQTSSNETTESEETTTETDFEPMFIVEDLDLLARSRLVGCTINNQHIKAFFFSLPSNWQYRHEEEHGGAYLTTLKYFEGPLYREGFENGSSGYLFRYMDDSYIICANTFLETNTPIPVYEEDGKLHIEGYGCDLVLQETSENIWEVISDDAEITVIKNEDGNDTRVTIKKGTKFEWRE